MISAASSTVVPLLQSLVSSSPNTVSSAMLRYTSAKLSYTPAPIPSQCPSVSNASPIARISSTHRYALEAIPTTPFLAVDPTAGAYSSRCFSNSGSNNSRCAVENDKIESAVSPFVRAAKESFNVDAAPILADTNFMFSTSASLGNEAGNSTCPEIIKLGFFQCPSGESLDGGGPMMPPSR